MISLIFIIYILMYDYQPSSYLYLKQTIASNTSNICPHFFPSCYLIFAGIIKALCITPTSISYH